MQLAGQVAVLGEDRAEQREAVVGGVRGQEQDERGGGRSRMNRKLPLPKTASATWEITGCWTKSGPTGTPLSSRLVAGDSAIRTLVDMARPMIPQNMVTARMPMSARVVAAFLLLGLRKAGTPLLIASTPVRAAQPEEKARSSRKTRAKRPAPGVRP